MIKMCYNTNINLTNWLARGCKSMFNAEKVKNECIEWIREFFKNNGDDCKAVVGISGGKDSSIVAALCVKRGAKLRLFIERSKFRHYFFLNWHKKAVPVM